MGLNHGAALFSFSLVADTPAQVGPTAQAAMGAGAAAAFGVFFGLEVTDLYFFVFFGFFFLCHIILLSCFGLFVVCQCQ